MGILPGAYDDEGDGGQDVVGAWEKEDGLFKLDFRKFKNRKIRVSPKNFGNS